MLALQRTLDSRFSEECLSERCRLPAGGMNAVIFATIFAHTIPLHLENPLSSPGTTNGREEYNSRLRRWEDVSLDGIARMVVSTTHFSAHGCIEGRHKIGYR